MTETEQFDISSDSETTDKPKLRAKWRHNPDGTYNNKPIDKDYFKKYYEQHYKNQSVICDKCGYTTAKQKIRRHQKSKHCLNVQEFIDNKLKSQQ